MPASHHRVFLHQLRVLLVFIEFNILIFILMERQRAHWNPAPSPAIQPPAQPKPQPSPQKKNKATKPLGHALDTSETRKGMLQQPPGPPHPHRHPRVSEFCQDASCLLLPHRGTHFSWTETGHNPETPGHWRDLHLPAIPLVGWPHHHVQIRPPGLLSHPF